MQISIKEQNKTMKKKKCSVWRNTGHGLLYFFFHDKLQTTWTLNSHCPAFIPPANSVHTARSPKSVNGHQSSILLFKKKKTKLLAVNWWPPCTCLILQDSSSSSQRTIILVFFFFYLNEVKDIWSELRYVIERKASTCERQRSGQSVDPVIASLGIQK